MAGIDSITSGISNISSANTNLSNFKLDGDGVKERNIFGKLFTRISDYFANKSISGRAMIAQRNQQVGRAMLNMVDARLATKMQSIDTKATAKGLALDSADIINKKETLTQNVQNLRARISTLTNSSEKNYKALHQLQTMARSPEQAKKFMNSFDCKFNKKVGAERLHAHLTRLASEDGFDKVKGTFDKDVHRKSVKQFGDTVYNSAQHTAEDIHDYLDTVSKGSDDVKKFLMATMHQGGILAASTIFVYNADYGQTIDQNLADFGEFVSGNVMLEMPGHEVRITTEDSGAINMTGKLNIHYNKAGSEKNYFSQQLSVNIHVPVDKTGNFILKDGVPKFEVQHFNIENIPQ